jgi:hypothetical protein
MNLLSAFTSMFKGHTHFVSGNWMFSAVHLHLFCTSWQLVYLEYELSTLSVFFLCWFLVDGQHCWSNLFTPLTPSSFCISMAPVVLKSLHIQLNSSYLGISFWDFS